MAKVLVVANNKGGVGKTTCVQVTAAYLSSIGKKVLLVDCDPQCNLTSAMIEINYEFTDERYLPEHPEETGRFDVANIFLEEQIAPYPTNLEHVDIIPCKPENIELDKGDNSLVDVFISFIHQEGMDSYYDVVIIDTPPAKGLLTTSAIRSSTHVLIPVVLERKSVEGLLGMIQKVMSENDLKNHENQSEILGILPNKVDARYRIHKDYLKQLNDHDEMGLIAELMMPGQLLDQGNQLASFVIKERPALKEMELTGATPKTPFAVSKSQDIHKEWSALGGYIVQEMGL